MADLSKHRGTASALLAAGVAALGVIGGASAIVGTRGAVTPAEAAWKGATHASAASAKPRHVKVKGLTKWHKPRIPARLKLKPVVKRAHKVVTIVTSVAALRSRTSAAKASPAKAKRWSKTRHRHAKTRATKPKRHAKTASKPSTHASATSSAAAGSGTAPSAPPAPPAPPAAPPPPPSPPGAPPAPPPPAAPTGTVSIKGGNSAGDTVRASWAGVDPAAMTFQWDRCDKDGKACAPIAGMTAETYVLQTSEIGLTIRVRVTFGQYSSTSKTTDQIERAG